MLRRRSNSDKPKSDQSAATASDLFRAPIITEHLIIREALRADAPAIERTMDAAALEGGARTADGARRFGSALAEVPVWSATRAVCEKGTAQIVGGVVLTTVGDAGDHTQRLGWWLEPDAQVHDLELLSAVLDRQRALGTAAVIVHVRAASQAAIDAVERVGFERGEAVRHETHDGQTIDFWEYRRAITG